MTQAIAATQQSKVRYSLLVYRAGIGDASEETIGEYPYTVPYGSPADVSLEPLRKLKPELVGVILGQFGIVAVSSDLRKDHPMWRAAAVQVERESQVQA